MTIHTLMVLGFGHHIGWALVFPFIILKVLLFIFIIKFLFRRFAGRRWRNEFGSEYACNHRGGMREKFRNMTEEQRKEFFAHRKHRGHRNKHTDEDGFVNPINK